MVKGTFYCLILSSGDSYDGAQKDVMLPSKKATCLERCSSALKADFAEASFEATALVTIQDKAMPGHALQ